MQQVPPVVLGMAVMTCARCSSATWCGWRWSTVS